MNYRKTRSRRTLMLSIGFAIAMLLGVGDAKPFSQQKYLAELEVGMKKMLADASKELAGIKDLSDITSDLKKDIGNLNIEYYGKSQPLHQIADITDTRRTINVSPRDKRLGNNIVAAINGANLGVKATLAGDVVAVGVTWPEPIHNEAMRSVRTIGAAGRQKLDNYKKDAALLANDLRSKNTISEDERRTFLDHVQKQQDKYRANLDKLVSEKQSALEHYKNN